MSIFAYLQLLSINSDHGDAGKVLFETGGNYYGDKTPNIWRFKIPFDLAAKSAFSNSIFLTRNFEKETLSEIPVMRNIQLGKV